MQYRGIIGGRVGYYLLRRLARFTKIQQTYCSGKPYENRSKLEVLFGAEIWETVKGKNIIDFGCGTGEDAIDLAMHGANRVIGIDIREKVLTRARANAEKAGVSDRCVFVTETDEVADLILSVDGFEHYQDPAAILHEMRRLVNNHGPVLVCFGPPWLHPLGGHGFSIIPWAHLIFTEKALIRWRSDFKSDGATRFQEIEGGLNQMTLRRFEALLTKGPFHMENFEAVPIRKFRRLHTRWTREFFTSVVRCRLVPRAIAMDTSTTQLHTAMDQAATIPQTF